MLWYILMIIFSKFSSFIFLFPRSFDRPCENMILTLTGFEDRDRDWVKAMITMSGAKYTSYFTKHNHAIICRRFEIYDFFGFARDLILIEVFRNSRLECFLRFIFTVHTLNLNEFQVINATAIQRPPLNGITDNRNST